MTTPLEHRTPREISVDKMLTNINEEITELKKKFDCLFSYMSEIEDFVHTHEESILQIQEDIHQNKEKN
jgi:hypothetical protein